MIGSDVLSAFRVFHEKTTGKPLVEAHNLLKCEIRRTSLFEDGVLLIRKVGPTVFHFETKFVGEEGSGIGPTREFFTLLANEFGLASRGMWRNPGQNAAEYAIDPMGLFPHFTANPDLFFLLGLFCGKALQMGYLVPLPFNPAFFKLMKGEKVEISEIDPVYDIGFEGMEDMPFLYPGTDIELIANGKKTLITAGNFSQYKEKIYEFTCGSKVMPCVAAFQTALGKIFKPNVWNLLSATEILILITGEESPITTEDLLNHIDLSNGYCSESPEIGMLFEILLEFTPQQQGLFLKFVTGSSRLPIGGLSSLRPKLTIACKNQSIESLPSATVCYNYFKLPPYPNKSLMKSKLLTAIEEGQDRFTMS